MQPISTLLTKSQRALPHTKHILITNRTFRPFFYLPSLAGSGWRRLARCLGVGLLEAGIGDIVRGEGCFGKDVF